MSGYELVNSYDEVVENVRRFDVDLSREVPGISSLSQFRHWYQVPKLWMTKLEVTSCVRRGGHGQQRCTLRTWPSLQPRSWLCMYSG